MKILIAEDDVTSRAILESILKKWDYEVVSTCDGKEAYEALQEDNAPQLAILDWEMPGLDGVSLCRQLRSRQCEEPLYLILLTSRDDREDIIHGLEAGADDYLSKPYDHAELRARVEVGRRMIRLQNRMRAQERLQGVMVMAGAVCQGLKQPMQSVIDSTEKLLANTPSDDPNALFLNDIKDGVERVSVLIRKLTTLTREDFESFLKNRKK